MKSNKFVRVIFGLILSCFIVAGITSCEPPSGSSVASPSAGNSFDKYELPDVATAWENTGYGSTYVISKNEIIDVATDCEFEVVSQDTVLSKDGYTLVFVKVTKGTQYTPVGNYYCVSLKLTSGKLSISCPLDYSSFYKSLDELKAIYTATYNTGAGVSNFYTECTLVDTTAKNPVALKDGYWSLEVKFDSNKVTISMADVSYNFNEVFSFVPRRDKSKETGDVSLYLYDASARESYNYGTAFIDHHYVEIKNSSGKKVVNYVKHKMVYDEDEEDYVWSSTLEGQLNGLFPDMMPVVNSYNLTQILALYE